MSSSGVYPTGLAVLQLRRTIRFSVNPPPEPGGAPPPVKGPNGFAASPPMCGLGRHYEIDALCRGEPDPVTGYLFDIKDIDRAVREYAIPVIAQACQARPWTDPITLLPDLFAAVRGVLGPRLHILVWRLSPYYGVEMREDDLTKACLRQRFDFSASHRLHTQRLSEEENSRRFGKCNNPSGHGHNYQIEPCVEIDIGPGAPPALQLARLEQLTEESVIRRFDHKNLNTDTAEFAPGTGIVPTVEHIARVCYQLLAPAVAAASSGARLRSVTVWETDRTCCTYPA